MSRYQTPGSVISCFYDGRSGLAVVTATSRHRDVFSETAGETLLWPEVAAHLGLTPDELADVQDHRPSIVRHDRWQSVTAWDIEMGDVPDEVDVGGWSNEGTGQAFMDVMYVMFSDVETVHIRAFVDQLDGAS